MDNPLDLLSLPLFENLLQLGMLGLVAGVVLPFGFVLVGYVLDTVRTVLK